MPVSRPSWLNLYDNNTSHRIINIFEYNNDEYIVEHFNIMPIENVYFFFLRSNQGIKTQTLLIELFQNKFNLNYNQSKLLIKRLSKQYNHQGGALGIPQFFRPVITKKITKQKIIQQAINSNIQIINNNNHDNNDNNNDNTNSLSLFHRKYLSINCQRSYTIRSKRRKYFTDRIKNLKLKFSNGLKNFTLFLRNLTTGNQYKRVKQFWNYANKKYIGKKYNINLLPTLSSNHTIQEHAQQLMNKKNINNCTSISNAKLIKTFNTKSKIFINDKLFERQNTITITKIQNLKLIKKSDILLFINELLKYGMKNYTKEIYQSIYIIKKRINSTFTLYDIAAKLGYNNYNDKRIALEVLNNKILIQNIYNQIFQYKKIKIHNNNNNNNNNIDNINLSSIDYLHNIHNESVNYSMNFRLGVDSINNIVINNNNVNNLIELKKIWIVWSSKSRSIVSAFIGYLKKAIIQLLMKSKNLNKFQLSDSMDIENNIVNGDNSTSNLLLNNILLYNNPNEPYPFDLIIWADKCRSQTAIKIRIIDHNGILYDNKKSDIVDVIRYIGNEEILAEHANHLSEDLNECYQYNFWTINDVNYNLKLKRYFLLGDHHALNILLCIPGSSSGHRDVFGKTNPKFFGRINLQNKPIFSSGHIAAQFYINQTIILTTKNIFKKLFPNDNISNNSENTIINFVSSSRQKVTSIPILLRSIFENRKKIIKLSTNDNTNYINNDNTNVYKQNTIRALLSSVLPNDLFEYNNPCNINENSNNYKNHINPLRGELLIKLPIFDRLRIAYKTTCQLLNLSSEYTTQSCYQSFINKYYHKHLYISIDSLINEELTIYSYQKELGLLFDVYLLQPIMHNNGWQIGASIKLMLDYIINENNPQRGKFIESYNTAETLTSTGMITASMGRLRYDIANAVNAFEHELSSFYSCIFTLSTIISSCIYSTSISTPYRRLRLRAATNILLPLLQIIHEEQIKIKTINKTNKKKNKRNDNNTANNDNGELITLTKPEEQKYFYQLLKKEKLHLNRTYNIDLKQSLPEFDEIFRIPLSLISEEDFEASFRDLKDHIQTSRSETDIMGEQQNTFIRNYAKEKINLKPLSVKSILNNSIPSIPKRNIVVCKCMMTTFNSNIFKFNFRTFLLRTSELVLSQHVFLTRQGHWYIIIHDLDNLKKQSNFNNYNKNNNNNVNVSKSHHTDRELILCYCNECNNFDFTFLDNLINNSLPWNICCLNKNLNKHFHDINCKIIWNYNKYGIPLAIAILIYKLYQKKRFKKWAKCNIECLEVITLYNNIKRYEKLIEKIKKPGPLKEHYNKKINDSKNKIIEYEKNPFNCLNIRLLIKKEFWIRKFKYFKKNNLNNQNIIDKEFNNIKIKISNYLLQFMIYDEYYEKHFKIYLINQKEFEKHASYIKNNIKEYILLYKQNITNNSININNNDTYNVLYFNWLTKMNYYYKLELL
jgi:hypothetical protein